MVAIFLSLGSVFRYLIVVIDCVLLVIQRPETLCSRSHDQICFITKDKFGFPVEERFYSCNRKRIDFVIKIYFCCLVSITICRLVRSFLLCRFFLSIQENHFFELFQLRPWLRREICWKFQAFFSNKYFYFSPSLRHCCKPFALSWTKCFRFPSGILGIQSKTRSVRISPSGFVVLLRSCIAIGKVVSLLKSWFSISSFLKIRHQCSWYLSHVSIELWDS